MKDRFCENNMYPVYQMPMMPMMPNQMNQQNDLYSQIKALEKRVSNLEAIINNTNYNTGYQMM